MSNIWLICGLFVALGGAALIAGGVYLAFFDEYGSIAIGGLLGFCGVAIVLAVVGIAIGAVRFSSPLAPGCYYADVQTSTTYVMSGKVLVPITGSSNVFYSIPCPAGVGR